MPKVGDCVKYSDLAFVNGVAKIGTEARRLRGVIISQPRNQKLWSVKWDGRLTVDLLDKSFVVKATTGQRLSM